MKTLTQQLREAASQYVRTHATLAWAANECGMSVSQLSRFLAGKGGISMEAADRLASYVGVGIAAVKPS